MAEQSLLQAESEGQEAKKRRWNAKVKEKKSKRRKEQRKKKDGCFKGAELSNALFPALLHIHTLHADSSPLPRSYCLLCNELQMCC